MKLSKDAEKEALEIFDVRLKDFFEDCRWGALHHDGHLFKAMVNAIHDSVNNAVHNAFLRTDQPSHQQVDFHDCFMLGVKEAVKEYLSEHDLKPILAQLNRLDQEQ